ncbi:enterobactin transporter EntS [Microbulbifer elongatus]|uniref:enterobactin transporter EntS n=1 Tax=Microbulbifer elongatus TaxID=86173 RepID=UPI001E50F2FC|nr:enterobactin transporter EntS [Microbulbifer elongatus]
MSKKSIFVDFSILKTNRHFRNVFIARTISLLGLGMLSVAIPLQTYELTKDSFHVGLVMAIEGIGLFVGLLWGGVLADQYDRKKLILFARSTCGIGFLGLALNAWLPEPQLWVLYALAAWDGFFGALGVTALLAAMPFIVGREHLVQARAVSMVSMRLATVISPALGGAIIAASHVGWNYLLAALGTGLTLIPLLGLPRMQPPPMASHNPLRALADGFVFIWRSPVVLAVVLLGTLVTLITGVRVLFPAWVETIFAGGAFELGLFYAAVPVGATLGALVSGWANHVRRPGVVMALTALGAFAVLAVLGLNANLPVALVLLAAFGYLVSITGLLQYGLVQEATPDQYLGRVNAIWMAQDASGDSLGSVGAGALGKFLSTSLSIFALGAVSFGLALLLCAMFGTLRSFGKEAQEVSSSGEDSDAAGNRKEFASG